MAITVDEKVLEHLKKVGAVSPETQRRISDISEAIGHDFQNVRLALERLCRQNRTEVSSPHTIQRAYPSPSIQVDKHLREEHLKTLGTVWAWLGKLELEEMEKSRRALEQHEAQLRIASALEKLVSRPAPDAITTSTSSPQSHATVLFFACNPKDQSQLRLDQEARAIGQMIRMSDFRDVLQIQTKWAVQPLDLLQAVNEFNPRIVHFSGHGGSDGYLAFEDEAGNTKLVGPEALAKSLHSASDDIQLVFLNACHSVTQAEIVCQYVPAAVGMKSSIGDNAAKVFAMQFYSALGFGHSVQRAFDQAKAGLMLEGIEEDDIPKLYVRSDIDPGKFFIVRPPPVGPSISPAHDVDYSFLTAVPYARMVSEEYPLIGNGPAKPLPETLGKRIVLTQTTGSPVINARVDYGPERGMVEAALVFGPQQQVHAEGCFQYVEGPCAPGQGRYELDVQEGGRALVVRWFSISGIKGHEGWERWEREG